MKINAASRFLDIARGALLEPRHYFEVLAEEASSRSWTRRAARLPRIPEVEFLELVNQREIDLALVTFRPGGSSVPDHLLLAALCKSHPSCAYFEIGTFLGESLANVAPCCAQCVSLSLHDEEFSGGAPTQAAEVSRIFSKTLSNVTHLYGDSLHYDFSQVRQKFDVVFIDGCHDYRHVVSDTANALKLLRDENSAIVFHDAKDAHNELNMEVMMGIHDALPVEWRPRLYTVENTHCAIATRRPLRTIERVSLRRNFFAKPRLKFRLKAWIEEVE
jgi:hypothetical protein